MEGGIHAQCRGSAPRTFWLCPGISIRPTMQAVCCHAVVLDQSLGYSAHPSPFYSALPTLVTTLLCTLTRPYVLVPCSYRNLHCCWRLCCFPVVAGTVAGVRSVAGVPALVGFPLLLGFPTVVGDPTLPNAPSVEGVPILIESLL